MDHFSTNLIIAIISYLLMQVAGAIIAKSGKPYKTSVFTVHKLAALAAIVLFVLWILPILNAGSATLFLWILFIAAAVLVLMLFITGGIVSTKSKVPAILTKIHKASSFALLVILAILVGKILVM